MSLEHKERRKLIEAYVSGINKELSKSKSPGRVDLGSDIQYVDPPRISSGILGLDIISSGGLPRANLSQLWGTKSTCKTASALRSVRTAQEEIHASVAWAVSENFNKPWARQLGCMIPYSNAELEALADDEGEEYAAEIEEEQEDWPEFTLLQHQHGDALLELVYRTVKSNLFDLVIVDSLGSIKRYRNVEERSLEDEQYSGESALFGAFVGKMYSAFNTKYDPDTLAVLEKPGKEVWIPNNTAVVCINQARQKIGGYNPTGRTQYQYAGGEALKHAYALSVFFSDGPRMFVKGKQDKKDYYAQEVRAKVDKCKVGPPLREAEWDFYFSDYGEFDAGDVDRVKEVFAWADYYGFIERAGAYYSIGGTRVQGKDSALKLLEEDHELVDQLWEDCIEQARKM